MICLLYKVNNYMLTFHVSFYHTSKPCDFFLNPMLEALKVLLRNVGGGESMWPRVYSFILNYYLIMFFAGFFHIWFYFNHLD